jgi:hypothetical protein
MLRTDVDPGDIQLFTFSWISSLRKINTYIHSLFRCINTRRNIKTGIQIMNNKYVILL